MLDDGDEGVAQFGQAVLGMAADGVDDALLDDAVLHQFLQLLGQHALTGLGHPALQFTRTLRAVQQFVDDIGFPFAAHHLDGDTEAATDVYGYLLVVHIECKGTNNPADSSLFPLNTAKIISIVLRKLSVFRRLAASWNRCNFAVAMKKLKIETKRGVLLDGVLFAADGEADTVLIAITGIHGNFYSNPFYYNIGDTLSAAGIDFIYAQTNDAFGAIRTMNTHTGREEIIGSWNERFALADEDIEAYLDYAEKQGYRHIILAGHSLGANKVIYYLSRHHERLRVGEQSSGIPRVEHFLLLSPANLDYMTASVTPCQRELIRQLYERGDGDKMLPFLLMGWVECTVGTAYDWVHSGLLNNVHTSPDGELTEQREQSHAGMGSAESRRKKTEGQFSQVSQITHTGALLIGTYDNFTDGDPSGFLRTINSHMPTAAENRLLFIERTGHTYQQKHQEVADKILQLIRDWREAAKQ